MVRFGETEFIKNDFLVQFEWIKFQTFKLITIRHAWEKTNFNFYNPNVIRAVYAEKTFDIPGKPHFRVNNQLISWMLHPGNTSK